MTQKLVTVKRPRLCNYYTIPTYIQYNNIYSFHEQFVGDNHLGISWIFSPKTKIIYIYIAILLLLCILKSHYTSTPNPKWLSIYNIIGFTRFHLSRKRVSPHRVLIRSKIYERTNEHNIIVIRTYTIMVRK